MTMEETLKGMLNSYSRAYKAVAECDKYIDEAISIEVAFADSDAPIEEYLFHVQGEGAKIGKQIMKLSQSLNSEIERIKELLKVTN